MAKSYGRLYQNNTNVSITPMDIYNVYPIGSIYISVIDTNPSNYFGGVWESFGEGRCLVGVDTSQTEFNIVEKIGGSKAHTLTITEIPSHTHSFSGTTSISGEHRHNTQGQWRIPLNTSATNRCLSYNYISGDDSRSDNPIRSAGSHNHTFGGITSGTGSTGSHNNLQPYITVYMWKRIS